jgi:hypothetical protein
MRGVEKRDRDLPDVPPPGHTDRHNETHRDDVSGITQKISESITKPIAL